MTTTTDKTLLPANSVTLPERGWRIAPAHALLAATVCWAGFFAMVFAVNRNLTTGFDAAGLLVWRTGTDLHARAPGWVLEGVRDFTALGGVLLRNIIALGAIAALLFLLLRREAVLLAATIASGWIVDSLIKHFVGRPRPTLVSHLTEAGGTSFPSGHSFNSAVVYFGIALAFAAISPRRAVRWTLIASAAVLVLLVAMSRVWLGVHYPSDVVAGALGGAAWAFTASAVLYRPARAVADTGAETLEAITPGEVSVT